MLVSFYSYIYQFISFFQFAQHELHGKHLTPPNSTCYTRGERCSELHSVPPRLWFWTDTTEHLTEMRHKNISWLLIHRLPGPILKLRRFPQPGRALPWRQKSFLPHRASSRGAKMRMTTGGSTTYFSSPTPCRRSRGQPAGPRGAFPSWKP